MFKLKKILPISILIAGLVLFFVFGGQHYLSLQALSENYKKLQDYTHAHYFLSVLGFMGCYIIIIALSIPGATLLTLLGGFLFGALLGTVWVVFAATIGATITFLAVHTAFGELLRHRVDNKLSKMKKGFTENAFNYLITLRLLPIFPFFIINIAAGVIGMPLRTFFFGTLLGIIPGSFIYAWVGSGLGYTLEQGKSLNLGIIFEPQVILPIIGLAILSLAPVIVKKYKAKHPKIS